MTQKKAQAKKKPATKNAAKKAPAKKAAAKKVPAKKVPAKKDAAKKPGRPAKSTVTTHIEEVVEAVVIPEFAADVAKKSSALRRFFSFLKK